MPPTAVVRRIAWLIPPPDYNRLRFHGLCASRAADRAAFVALAPSALAAAASPIAAVAAPADDFWPDSH